MRILVTGHQGYIGAVLASMLMADGHDVVGLDTDFFADCTFGEDPAPVPAMRKDLRDVNPSDLDGFEAVLHLAALSNDPLGDFNPHITFAINHRAAVSLAAAAKAAGVERFIFSSSCSLYGAGGRGLLDEEAPMAPVTPYGESKVLAEENISKLADDAFTPVYLRNATAYGSSPRLRLDLVVNNLTCWAFTTGQVRILSDGSPWRPLVHVIDICSAFRAALTAPREAIHNQAINIGKNGENHQIRDVADIVGSVVPGSRVTYAEGGEADKRNYRVDFSKALDLLPGFSPSWTVRAGAEELYKDFLTTGFSDRDLEGEKYFRIRRIRSHLTEGRLTDDLRWRTEPAPVVTR